LYLLVIIFFKGALLDCNDHISSIVYLI
jgi:hypothetical protein